MANKKLLVSDKRKKHTVGQLLRVGKLLVVSAKNCLLSK